MKKYIIIAALCAAFGISSATAQTTDKKNQTTQSKDRKVPTTTLQKRDKLEKVDKTDLPLTRPVNAVAEIKFDSLRRSFGTFSSKEPIVKTTFKFTNTGSAPLVIHQALASCGCTVPSFPKNPIKPGETGNIEVTYNGTGKFPGHFQKTITVRTNAKNEVVRLVIEGEMTEK